MMNTLVQVENNRMISWERSLLYAHQTVDTELARLIVGDVLHDIQSFIIRPSETIYCCGIDKAKIIKPVTPRPVSSRVGCYLECPEFKGCNKKYATGGSRPHLVGCAGCDRNPRNNITLWDRILGRV